MHAAEERVSKFKEKLNEVCRSCGRDSSEIKVVAVSKTKTAECIREALKLGFHTLGENRLQEAEPKIGELSGENIEWHFLGRIQSNKIKKIVRLFDVIQSVDRIDVLEMCEKILSQSGGTREIFLQVNISGEIQKGGFSYEAIAKFFEARQYEQYPHQNQHLQLWSAPVLKVRQTFQ